MTLTVFSLEAAFLKQECAFYVFYFLPKKHLIYWCIFFKDFDLLCFYAIIAILRTNICWAPHAANVNCIKKKKLEQVPGGARIPPAGAIS